MLHVQDFLRNGGTLEWLQTELGIYAKRHGAYEELVLLKYDQIEAPLNHPIVVECRGIILNEKDNWNVVAMPYKRFFNYGQAEAAEIDWDSAKYYEKLDGSAACLFYYDRTWHVATSGTPDASGQVGSSGMTFKDLFWDALDGSQNCWYLAGFLDTLDTRCCYMFELCCPENRVVVNHKTSKIYLHGARNLTTLEEQIIPVTWGVPVCPRYNFSSVAEAVHEASNRNPIEHEGFVVCDKYFNRIKIKSPAYVALHHAKGSLNTPKSVAEIIRIGEYSEAVNSFQELKETFDKLKAEYDLICVQADAVWRTICDVTDRKEFALFATRHSFAAYLFARKDNKTPNPKQWMKGLTANAYGRLMGLD